MKMASLPLASFIKTNVFVTAWTEFPRRVRVASFIIQEPLKINFCCCVNNHFLIPFTLAICRIQTGAFCLFKKESLLIWVIFFCRVAANPPLIHFLPCFLTWGSSSRNCFFYSSIKSRNIVFLVFRPSFCVSFHVFRSRQGAYNTT